MILPHFNLHPPTNPFNYVGGLKVMETSTLPIERTYKACDVETKQEYSICTGEMIDAVEFDGVLFVSKKVYTELRNLKLTANGN